MEQPAQFVEPYLQQSHLESHIGELTKETFEETFEDTLEEKIDASQIEFMDQSQNQQIICNPKFYVRIFKSILN